MTPEHRVIVLASQQDYGGFYELEAGLREAKGCPPYRDLYTITFSGPEEGQVLRGAALFRDSLLGCLEADPYRGLACQVLGPAPCGGGQNQLPLPLPADAPNPQKPGSAPAFGLFAPGGLPRTGPTGASQRLQISTDMIKK